MTNKIAESVLIGLYGDSTKQLLDLVMAAEKAFDSYGKTSIFGKDKGKDAEANFTSKLMIAIIALSKAGKISDVHNAEESFTELQKAMNIVREAYPNWPRAYMYWDEFITSTYNK